MPQMFQVTNENPHRVVNTYYRRRSDSLKRRRYRVVVHGLRFFCQKLPGLLANETWDIRDRSRHSPGQLVQLSHDLLTCDLAFSWGGRVDMGRFLWAARAASVRKVVIFWCGSDVLRAQKILSTRKVDPWIAQQIHWAASPMLTKEVRSIGLQCEFVQASFVEVVREPKALPKDFSVIVFMPRANDAQLYGWDRIIEVATALPHVKFRLVGLHPGETITAPPNIKVNYRVPDLTSIYQDSTVLWRPVRHDAGISFMVLEALSHGRHVLYTYPLAGAIQVRDAQDAKAELERVFALHERGVLPLNERGMETVAGLYARDVVRENLYKRWEEIICS